MTGGDTYHYNENRNCVHFLYLTSSDLKQTVFVVAN